MPDRPQRHRAVDRGHERGVYLGRAVVVEPENHAAESWVVRHVLRLHAVEHQPPAGAVLAGELRHAIHRVADRALVPRREAERSGDPRDVVRVRAVLHLRLEPLALVTPIACTFAVVPCESLIDSCDSRISEAPYPDEPELVAPATLRCASMP